MVGDPCAWMKGLKGVWCLKCAPQPVLDWSASQPPAAATYTTAFPASVPRIHVVPDDAPDPPKQPTAVAKPMDVEALSVVSLAAFENLVVAKMAAKPPTPEMEQTWSVYQKCKKLALNTNNEHERDLALRKAMTKILELVF
jgi:hypothetical protein